eukprot:scaffold3104_cov64-Phaeocystis_antarctica.AAC.1
MIIALHEAPVKLRAIRKLIVLQCLKGTMELAGLVLECELLECVVCIEAVRGFEGVQERTLVGQKLFEFKAVDVEPVEFVPNCGRAFDVHVPLITWAYVHNLTNVSELAHDAQHFVPLHLLNALLDEAKANALESLSRYQFQAPNAHFLFQINSNCIIHDLFSTPLYKPVDEFEHSWRPRNDVRAVYNVVRCLIQLNHQGWDLFWAIKTQYCLWRSECTGEPINLVVKLGPGRSSFLELTTNHKVRDVCQTSPERVPGEENALHLVFVNKAHDIVLVLAKDMFHNIDIRTVRADFVTTMCHVRPARGCQIVKWTYVRGRMVGNRHTEGATGDIQRVGEIAKLLAQSNKGEEPRQARMHSKWWHPALEFAVPVNDAIDHLAITLDRIAEEYHRTIISAFPKNCGVVVHLAGDGCKSLKEPIFDGGNLGQDRRRTVLGPLCKSSIPNVAVQAVQGFRTVDTLAESSRERRLFD